MSAIRSITLRRVERPMRTTFATALGRKAAAVSVLVRVRLAGGAVGTGEAPTSFVSPRETPPIIERILRATREF